MSRIPSWSDRTRRCRGGDGKGQDQASGSCARGVRGAARSLRGGVPRRPERALGKVESVNGASLH
jgi:hypothetical protein